MLCFINLSTKRVCVYVCVCAYPQAAEAMLARSEEQILLKNSLLSPLLLYKLLFF